MIPVALDMLILNKLFTRRASVLLHVSSKFIFRPPDALDWFALTKVSEAALVAFFTSDNLSEPVFSYLVRPVGIGNHLPADSDQVAFVFAQCLGGILRIFHAANCNHRYRKTGLERGCQICH